jgi:hypothetical protein
MKRKNKMIFNKKEIEAYTKIQSNMKSAIERVVEIHNNKLKEYGNVTLPLESFDYLLEVELKEEDTSLDEDMVKWYREDNYCGTCDTYYSSVPFRYLSMTEEELVCIFEKDFQYKLDVIKEKSIKNEKIKKELKIISDKKNEEVEYNKYLELKKIYEK